MRTIAVQVPDYCARFGFEKCANFDGEYQECRHFIKKLTHCQDGFHFRYIPCQECKDAEIKPKNQIPLCKACGQAVESLWQSSAEPIINTNEF